MIRSPAMEILSPSVVFDRLEARAVREAAGMSRRTMANRLNVAPLTVKRWELGYTTEPRGLTLLRYLSLLDQLRKAQMP